jgi:hypothetical protein
MYLCQRPLNKRGSQKRHCSGPYPRKRTATGLVIALESEEFTKTIYNALQVRAQNKAGQSLSMLVAYTYERNISDSTVSALRTSIT